MDFGPIWGRRGSLRKVLLGSGEFDSAPMVASPGIPAGQVKILREGYAKGERSRSHRGSEEERTGARGRSW